MKTELLEKMQLAGVNLDELTASLFYGGFLYHAQNCAENPASSTQTVDVPWSQVLKTPDAFCGNCYPRMTFGGMQTRKWSARVAKLINAEAILESRPTSLQELDDLTQKLTSDLYGHDKFLPEWVASLWKRSTNYAASRVSEDRELFEKLLIKRGLERAINEIERVALPECGDLESLLEPLRQKVTERLSDPTPRFLLSSGYFPGSGVLRTAVTTLYALSSDILQVPAAVLHLITAEDRSRFQIFELDEPLDEPTREALVVLYDPRSEGPYSDLAEALRAARKL